ncbi:hypothetical protein AQJ27_21885 [Streptomyces olivochromogenes]|nr:hypothetical protein AQJ27_21885 [Streptomyces olivochromogenes]
MTITAVAAPIAIHSVLLSLDESALDPAADVAPPEPFSGACDAADAEAEGEDEAEDEDESADLASRSPPFSLASGSTFAGPGL